MKLKIYFKSGNQVILDKIITWEVTGSSATDSITKFTIARESNPKEALIMQSISLGEIDCITELP